MIIPNFDPKVECISIVQDKDSSHLEVVKVKSDDERKESNMKVTQYISDHFKEIDTKSTGFTKLIESIYIYNSAENIEFKNPEFVLAALKVIPYGSALFIGNLTKNPEVMSAAIAKESWLLDMCDSTLLNNDDFLIKCLELAPPSESEDLSQHSRVLYYIIQNRFKGYPEIEAHYIMKHLFKNYNAKKIDELIKVLKAQIEQDKQIGSLTEEYAKSIESLSQIADELELKLKKREKEKADTLFRFSKTPDDTDINFK